MSVETALNHLKSIDTTKATGSDGIPGHLLKGCAYVLAPSLTKIFNTSLLSGVVPRLFKKAVITLIFKSGNKDLARNYRLISLLPIVSKILEKIVATQLKEHITERLFLVTGPPEQFAYCQGHSAEDAVTYIVNKLLQSRDSKESIGLVRLC